MSLRKLEAHRHFRTFNIGNWLSAKIYADARANKCSCGGSFNGKETLEGVDFPVCLNCGKTPKKYRIRAMVIDEYNQVKPRDIRHDDKGRRLLTTRACLGIIDKVKDDIEAGKFDVRQFESIKKKDQFLLKNFIPEYLDFHEKRVQRGELVETSYKSKIKYSKLLIPFFGSIDIAKINAPLIKVYHNSFTDKFSNRRMSMGELKAILNHAKDMGKIMSVPDFSVEASGKRDNVPNLKVTRDVVIPAIKNPVHREAIRMLEDYGLRPCEVRAIQYEQIDLVKERIIIDRHFSDRKMEKGRKSIKTGKMKSLDRPLTKELKEYIKSRQFGLPKAFLFPTTTGTALGPGDLSEAWREAEKEVGVKHAQMYGIRGAKITEVIEKKGVLKAKNFAGHTNATMTLSRYDHSSTNVDDVFDDELFTEEIG